MSILAEIVDLDPADQEKRDFEYFCRTYLGHHFSAPPAPYQLTLMEIFNTWEITPDQVERLKVFVKPAYWKTYEPLNGEQLSLNSEQLSLNSEQNLTWVRTAGL